MLVTLSENELDLVGGGSISRGFSINHSFNTNTNVSADISVSANTYIVAAPNSTVNVTNNIAVGVSVISYGGATIG